MTVLVVHLKIEGTIETDDSSPLGIEELLGKSLAGEDFAKQLRFHRQIKGLTLSQLSRLSGVSPSHIGRLERGDRLPSYKIALRLEEALKEKVG